MKRPKGGDIFTVPLSNGQFAVGRILWRKTGMMQIGIPGKVKSSEETPQKLAKNPPVRMFFISHPCFAPTADRGRKIIGYDGEVPDAREVDSYICGGGLSIAGKYVRRATPEDREKYPYAASNLPIPVEWYIHKLFGLPPRPNTLPGEIKLSFPWTEAIEWTASAARASSWKPVEKTLLAVVKAKYVEMDECHEAVAAAEVVSAAKGKPAKNLPAEVKQWVAKHPSKFDSSLVIWPSPPSNESAMIPNCNRSGTSALPSRIGRNTSPPC